MTDTLRELEDVVDDLALVSNHANPQECLPGPCQVVKGVKHTRPTTHTTYTTTPALLTSLDAAISASIGGTRSGRSLAHERSILDSEALEQAMKITATIRTWCAMVGVREMRGNLGGTLIAWRQAWLATHPDEASTAWYVAELRSWAGFIRSKLDATERANIELPCPVCGARDYDTADGNRDTWPIKITWRRGALERTAQAKCMAPDCGAEWPSWGAITELRDEYADRGQLDEAAHATAAAVRLAITDSGTCTEGVTRKEVFEPCGKPAVGLRYDPEEGHPYPVCPNHARGRMVTLGDITTALASA